MSKTAELQIEDVYFTLIDALSNSRDYLFFIQVGSNDSRTGDPATYGDPLQSFLKNEHWHGIMIEPVGYVFDRLLAKYSGVERLILENIAIAETNGTKDFYLKSNILIVLNFLTRSIQEPQSRNQDVYCRAEFPVRSSLL